MNIQILLSKTDKHLNEIQLGIRLRGGSPALSLPAASWSVWISTGPCEQLVRENCRLPKAVPTITCSERSPLRARSDRLHPSFPDSVNCDRLRTTSLPTAPGHTDAAAGLLAAHDNSCHHFGKAAIAGSRRLRQGLIGGSSDAELAI